MDALIVHLQENAILYGAIVVCGTPLIYVTRKFSVPTILYALEYSIYAAGMHLAMWCLVSVTRWFKESSSMRALDDAGRPEDAPEWGTPLINFWERTEYDPEWIWKVEVALLVVILLLMWRYRPMKIQRKSKRKTQEYSGKGKGKPGGFKGGVGKPGAKSARGTRGR